MLTLSPRDRHAVQICLLCGDRTTRGYSDRCDDRLFAEIAGAIVMLPEMTLGERIHHAFEAQRMEISENTADEIARGIYCDGLDASRSVAIAA